MNHEYAAKTEVSTTAKIAYGVLLPLVVFIAYQFALIGSQSGTGSWDGMTLFFGSLFITPGLLIANGWVIPVQWDSRIAVLLAGLGLPAVVGAVEFCWLYGPYKIRWAINSTMQAPFPWIWLFTALLFVPLLISIVYAVRRRWFHSAEKLRAAADDLVAGTLGNKDPGIALAVLARLAGGGDQTQCENAGQSRIDGEAHRNTTVLESPSPR